MSAGSGGTRRRQPKLILGWREWVRLPELGVEAIKAKLDTGARTSALHAFDVERFRHHGSDWVRFGVHPIQRKDHPQLSCAAKLLDVRRVRNSTGHTEVRCVIETLLACFGQSWAIELSLANRDQMGFRMLLGRTAMRGCCLVDPQLSYQLGTPRRPRGGGQHAGTAGSAARSEHREHRSSGA